MKNLYKWFMAWGGGLLILMAPPSVSAQAISTGNHDLSRTIRWEQVQTTIPNSAIAYPGTITACQRTQLAFRVSGPLVRIDVKPGDRMQKNQVLMQIDPQDFKDQIAVLKAQLEGARSRLTTARLDLQRAQTLFDQKVIPQADFDHMVNGQQIAAAQVSQVQAQLAIAERHLAYTSLKAPYDGIIIDTTVENHEMVSAGQPVIIVHDISVLEITVGVPENELIRHPLEAESRGIVRFPALGNQEFPASLKEWKTSADPATKTFDITFSLKAPENQKILPGMTAELIWSANGELPPVMMVPTKAISMDTNGSSMVWVYDPDRQKAFKQQVVTSGFIGDNRTIVSSGLTGNEKIITSGMDFITEEMDLTSRPSQEEHQQ